MDEAVNNMHQKVRTVNTIVHKQVPESIDESTLPPVGTLARVKQRGTLKIGYATKNLPMSFFNNDGELVGFDVELAELLADTLNVKAGFIPIEWSTMPQMLAAGDIDIMPGIWYRPIWFSSVQLTEPYFTATLGLAVRDGRREEFDTMKELHNADGWKIGVPLNAKQIEYTMQTYFGNANVEFVPIEFWRPFFEGEHEEVDAFLMPAEHASAWSLLYPHFSVVVPQPNPVHIPTGFAVALDARDLANVVNEWVIYATNAGMVDKSYQYWVTGQGANVYEQRWSIMRDVLGWVD
jgi:ABC-type amino acid transport substrate-binding protein